MPFNRRLISEDAIENCLLELCGHRPPWRVKTICTGVFAYHRRQLFSYVLGSSTRVRVLHQISLSTGQTRSLLSHPCSPNDAKPSKQVRGNAETLGSRCHGAACWLGRVPS